MTKLKAILCFFHRHHKYSYYTDECIRCGKKKESVRNKGTVSLSSHLTITLRRSFFVGLLSFNLLEIIKIYLLLKEAQVLCENLKKSAFSSIATGF